MCAEGFGKRIDGGVVEEGCDLTDLKIVFLEERRCCFQSLFLKISRKRLRSDRVEQVGQITVIVVCQFRKLSRAIHCVKMRIDVVHDGKAELSGVRCVEKIGRRSDVLEVTDQRNIDLKELGAEHFIAVRDTFGKLELGEHLSDKSPDHFTVQKTLLSSCEILHNRLKVLKKRRMIGAERKEIKVQGGIPLRDDLMKFGREGEIDISFGKLYGDSVCYHRGVPVRYDGQFEPVAM